MPICTTIFRPNSLTTDIAYVPASGYRRATMGGCSRGLDSMISTDRSNEKDGDEWHGDLRESVVAAARWVGAPGGNFNYRARTMLRFVLRAETIEVSSIVSGPVPTPAMWPNVQAARLKWRNGEAGGLQAIPTLTTESALLVRVGRGLYTPTGANEEPFGRNTAETGVSFDAAPTFGMAEATLAWADWATPDRSDKTLNLSPAAIDAFLKTITGASDDYLDISMRLQQEGVDGVNINRVLAAWEPFPPSLEIDFLIPDVILSGSRVMATGLPYRAQSEALPARAHATALPSRAQSEALPSRAQATAIPSRVSSGGL